MAADDILDYLETVDLKTKMRGYDQIEVDEIFDRVAEEIKILREELKNSKEKERIAEDHLESEIKRLVLREQKEKRRRLLRIRASRQKVFDLQLKKRYRY